MFNDKNRKEGDGFMNLNQLHYFVTLAHIEHYTRAAEMAVHYAAKSQPCHQYAGAGA